MYAFFRLHGLARVWAVTFVHVCAAGYVAMAFVLLLALSPVRVRLERAGLSILNYRRNCLRLVWWTGLLGLLVYELVLLLTFVCRGWWAGA